MNPKTNPECTRMLKDIGIISFVMVELNLYLDTHPHDHEAIEYYQHYKLLYNRMVKDFSERFYPLNLSNVFDSAHWTWSMAPMPWEGGY